MPFSDAARLLNDLGQIFKPPSRIDVVDAVEQNVIIATPGGYSGAWDRYTTPYMVEPMNLLSSRKHHSVIFVGPARTGKTQALIDGGIGYIISCDPSDCLVVHMTEDAARRYSRLRISRMLNNSPTLKDKMSKFAHDDNIMSKFFRNGTALMLAYPSPTQLSAQDYKFVFLSDYDRMPDDTGEGDVYTLALKRTQTFMSGGMCVVESSPGRDFTDASWKPTTLHEAPPVGGILGLYNSGDRRLWCWVCPMCNDDIILRPGLDLFNLPPQHKLIDEIINFGTKTTARKYAKIVCPSCGSFIDHSYKNDMNINGFWVSENDHENAIASFWLSGVAAKFQTWESLLDKEFTALKHYSDTGEEEKLKATRNTDQGIPYIPIGTSQQINITDLERRAEDLPKRVVPDGVRFLVASVDVQSNKFVVQVHGYGIDMECWIIDRFDIQHSDRELSDGLPAVVNPSSYKEDWELLIDKVILKRYPLNDGSDRDMGIIITVCDSGGKAGTTENAYSFWKLCKEKHLNDRFYLIKGERPNINANKPMIKRTIVDKNSNSARKMRVVGELPLYLLNTTLLKDSVYGNMKRTEVGKDYIHFPDWLPSWWYAELLSEKRTDKGWENPGRSRNESFDLLCYAKAGVMIKLENYWKRNINWDNPPPWAETWDNNSEVSNNDDESLQNITAKKRSSTRKRSVRLRMR